jgi:pantoate--beta-alanine ligase
MGYLHEGHAALIRRAAETCPVVVVSLFVNPLQFGPDEDFERYPRDFQRDIALAAQAGATDLYHPEPEAITPPDSVFRVNPGPMADHLCGRSRPGHFQGVATIVCKLFHIIQPDIAVFGWKDAQQFLILSRMVAELNMPVQMVGVETIREPDGLAMSSRNSYLSSQERQQAPVLYRALSAARDMAVSGELNCCALIHTAEEMIRRESDARIDYIEAVLQDNLQPVERIVPGKTLFALAAYLGKTRLIDNIRL